MPLDGICMQAVAEELRPELLGLRIDKVQQPARDQVILLLRGNKRLLLNAGANTPRIQLYGWSWTLLTTSVSRGGGPWCWRPWAAGPT